MPSARTASGRASRPSSARRSRREPRRPEGASGDAPSGPPSPAPPAPDGRTLALLDAYLEELRIERSLSTYTLRNYRHDLTAFLTWLAREDIASLSATRPDLRRYLAALMEGGTARASLARKVSTIHAFYRYLERTGELSGDPFYGVSAPKRAKLLPTVIEADEIGQLLATPPADTPAGLRDRALLELLYAGGLRVGELVRLDLSDVDLEHRMVVVLGKGNRQRGVVIGQPACAAVRRYVKQGRPSLLGRDPKRDRDAQALFLNKNGGRLTARGVQMLVRKWATAAGLAKEVHPHLLRHSFATHMLDNGAELRVVQELLGHTSANTTQIYADVTAERQRAAYEAAFYNQVRERRRREGEEHG